MDEMETEESTLSENLKVNTETQTEPKDDTETLLKQEIVELKSNLERAN